MLHAAVCPGLPATGVTHTISGNFSGEGRDSDAAQAEAAVIRQNVLTLYRPLPPLSETSISSMKNSCAVEHVSEVILNAPPLAAAACRPPGHAKDLLVLLLDDFRLSVIQYDALLMRWDTLALIQLDDRVGGSAANAPGLDALLRVDPSGSYAAVLAHRSELFMIPLLRVVTRAVAEKMDNDEEESAAASGTSTSPTADALTAVEVQKLAVKQAKVALNDWGDDDDDDDDDDESEQSGGNIAAAHRPQTPGPLEKEEHSGAAGQVGATSAVVMMHSKQLVDTHVLIVGPISHVHLRDVKKTIINVRDFQFVESTSDPHIAFLCEKVPTWAGRVKLVDYRTHTIQSQMLSCSVLWLRTSRAGADASLKMLPIGEVDNVPFNVTHMVPVPAFQQVPSAVMCFGRNTILHVGTKSGYGCYFNTHGREETEDYRSHTMTYESMQWSDAAQAESTDLTRTNLNFANCVAIPLLGSGNRQAEARNENLRMLVVTEDQGTVVEIAVETEGYAVSKLIASIVMTGCHCSSWAPLTADRYFFGSSNGDSRVIAFGKSTTFSVLQSFASLCPILDAELVDCSSALHSGKAASSSSAEEVTAMRAIKNSPYAALFAEVEVDTDSLVPLAERRAAMDLALCTGLNAAGAVCVVRNSMRDESVRAPLELNAVSVFFLESYGGAAGAEASDAGQKRQREESSAAAGATNAHLLMTGTAFTILFSVGSYSLQQVRGTALNVGARTVFAAVLTWLSGTGTLVQVTETDMRHLSAQGKRKHQHIVFTDTIKASAGPLGKLKAALLDEQSHCIFLHFDGGSLYKVSLEDTKTPLKPQLVLDSGVKAIALWASKRLLVAVQDMNLVFVDVGRDSSNETPRKINCFENFAVLPPYAVDGVPTPLAKLSARLEAETLPYVTHISVYDSHRVSGTVGGAITSLECTLVLLTSSGELMTYRVFNGGKASDGLQQPRRLIKDVHHLLDIKPKQEIIESVEARKLRLQKERASLEDHTLSARDCSERIVPFSDIGADGVRGMYVCGQHPVFLVHDSTRDQLVPCRHQSSSAVRGFAQFSSRDIAAGYVYCTEGFVHFAPLQAFGMYMGNGWWMRRVPLGATPQRIVYSPVAHGCFVVTSVACPYAPNKAPFDVSLRVHMDEEGTRTTSVEAAPRMQPIAPAPELPRPLNDQFTVEFLSFTGNWERCSGAGLALDENEQVLAAQCIELPRDTSTDIVKKNPTVPVCVLATAFPLGEDTTTRGRLLLLTASAPEHDSEKGELAEQKKRLRLVHSEPMRGPVTAVVGIQGTIAVAVGGTVRVLRYDWATDKLETIAMLYAGAYITKITAFRDYLIFGDLYQSVSFARFSAANHTITLLGRDANDFPVVHCDMLYHDRACGIVMSDAYRNLAIMGYTPRVQDKDGPRARVIESLLSVDGEYRVPGGSVVKMVRIRSLQSPSAVAIYATNYGEIGFVVPIGEQTSRTGQWMARRLQGDVQHAAGLTPRMFLGFRQDDVKRAIRGKEQLFHMPLLTELYKLDLRTRKAVAAAAQTHMPRALTLGATVYSEASIL